MFSLSFYLVMESVEDVVLGEGGPTVSGEDLLGDGTQDDHSWVQWYQRSWLEIEEREDGVLVNPETLAKKSYFPKSSADHPSGVTAVKRGLIRFLYLVIDYSDSMRFQDYKPNRVDFLIAELTNNFIPKFFQDNPLSYISIVVMRDGEAQFLTRMNGQPKFQIK